MARQPYHSGLIFAASITLAHFSVSTAMNRSEERRGVQTCALPISAVPHQQAGHVTAPDQCCSSQKVLAKAPSTRDPKRTLASPKSRNGNYGTSALSLRLDIRGLNHLGPLLGFYGYE